jgi:hypothetical protein
LIRSTKHRARARQGREKLERLAERRTNFWHHVAPFTVAQRSSDQESGMKKLKHEAELFKAALLAGVEYAEGRKAVVFEPTDSASQKLLYIYRLLVHDKVIQPLPEDQVAEATMRHKLAIWYSKQLPKDHPLLS